MPSIHLCHHDLPDNLSFPNGMVAIDTETNQSVDPVNAKMLLAQVGDGLGNAWLVKFDGNNYAAPNLKKLLLNPAITKLFHFARFDLAMLQRHLQTGPITSVFCTKIASRLVRPGAGKHNLRTLVIEYAGITLDKGEQMSDWAAPELTESQKAYAASDVLYLHTLHEKLSTELAAKDLTEVNDAALRFLATRVDMDLAGLPEADLFSHH